MGKDAKYVVRLTNQERVLLDGLLADDRTAKKKALRARVLLKADADGPDWTDAQIAEAFEVSSPTVERLRKRCVLEGLEAALVARPQAVRKPRKLDGAAESQLVALACSEAPEGRSEWTMQMLADRLVELQIVDEISDETVRKTLKKTNFSRGVTSNGSSHRRPTPSLSVRWRTC